MLSGVPQTTPTNSVTQSQIYAYFRGPDRRTRQSSRCMVRCIHEDMLILPTIKASLRRMHSQHDRLTFNIRPHSSLIEYQFCNPPLLFVVCLVLYMLGLHDDCPPIALCLTHPSHWMTGVPYISIVNTYTTLSFSKAQLLHQCRRPTHFVEDY